MLKYSGKLEMGEKETDLLFFSKSVVEFLERFYLAERIIGLPISDPEIAQALKDASDKEDFLKKHNTDYYNRVVGKNCFVFILCDFCLYMYKSLRCIFDFEPQVALTLARKPLIDDIFYLQYLYVDMQKAIDLIISGSADEKDVINSKNKDLDKNNCSIISKELGFGVDTIYYFRYGDKKEKIKGIRQLCNKALHIVISKDELLKTVTGELNFIGMRDDDIKNYIIGYLNIVPTLLLYVAKLSLKIHERIYQKEDKFLRDELDGLQNAFGGFMEKHFKTGEETK